MLDILDLYVYWNSSRGTPFLNLAFPVFHDTRLADLVREEGAVLGQTRQFCSKEETGERKEEQTDGRSSEQWPQEAQI